MSTGTETPDKTALAAARGSALHEHLSWQCCAKDKAPSPEPEPGLSSKGSQESQHRCQHIFCVASVLLTL